MNENGMNGRPNPARHFSIIAMVILCLSVMIFLIQIADTYIENVGWKRTIKLCGTLSMLFAILIFTEHHDLMTIISSFFGLIVVVSITREIYRSK